MILCFWYDYYLYRNWIDLSSRILRLWYNISNWYGHLILRKSDTHIIAVMVEIGAGSAAEKLGSVAMAAEVFSIME